MTLTHLLLIEIPVHIEGDLSEQLAVLQLKMHQALADVIAGDVTIEAIPREGAQ